MADNADQIEEFGANSWLVEEMFEQFQKDAQSVSEPWREFFSDFRSASRTSRNINAATAARRVPAATSAEATTATEAKSKPPQVVSPDAVPEPIRGVGAAIVANMERSLGVPTATSFRNVPARLLEVNRKAMNEHRSRHGLSKISFTHIIAYAVVRSIADAVPNKFGILPELNTIFLILESLYIPATQDVTI